MPLVSVLMSNYNTNEQYLREAIESILNQTLTDFEFIIIDDASTDGSLKVIESYLYDKRVKIIENKINLGLAKSLNKGLSIAKGDYIARADSDDIYYPERLEKQVHWMQNHPDYIVCGTWAEMFGEKSGVYKKQISNQEKYRIQLLFGNNPAIIHPSAMFNSLLLYKYHLRYNSDYRYAQDYCMWVECSKHSQLHIFEEVLIKYRVHSDRVSSSKASEQKKYSRLIIENQLKMLHIQIDDYLFDIHSNLINKSDSCDKEIKRWMKTLLFANKNNQIYSQKVFKKLLKSNWHLRIKKSLKKDHSFSNFAFCLKSYFL